jgi:hypothetical protein
MRTFINLISLMALVTAGAWADGIITITFDDPNQVGAPGQTLQFFGTITNTSSDTTMADAVYWNSDSFNLSLDSPDYTLTDDFANTPVYLTGGQSSGDIELFDITLANPVSDPPGIYLGTYGLIGGMDQGAQTASDNLAQADFSVDVTPEPATLALLGAGLALMGWAFRGRVRAGHGPAPLL